MTDILIGNGTVVTLDSDNRLMEQGALTLLEKPYSPDELTAAVDRAVSAPWSLRDAPSVGTRGPAGRAGGGP